MIEILSAKCDIVRQPLSWVHGDHPVCADILPLVAGPTDRKNLTDPEFFSRLASKCLAFTRVDAVDSCKLSRERTMEINGKALLWGIGIFVAIYVLHIVLLPSLIGKEAAESENQGLLYAINQALGLATCLVSGFVAAKKADHHGFVHGGIVGFVSTILTALMAMLWSIVTGAKFAGLATLPFWLVVNGFLCAFAGLLATNMVEDETAE